MAQFQKCVPSAAKPGIEGKPLIAAVNRCATQRQNKPIFSADCLGCFAGWEGAGVGAPSPFFYLLAGSGELDVLRAAGGIVGDG
jgi:hypothetical protein